MAGGSAALLILTRPHAFAASATRMDVYFDGQRMTRIRDRTSEVFEIGEGEHHFDLRMGRARSAPVSFSANPGHAYRFEVFVNGGAWSGVKDKNLQIRQIDESGVFSIVPPKATQLGPPPPSEPPVTKPSVEPQSLSMRVDEGSIERRHVETELMSTAHGAELTIRKKRTITHSVELSARSHIETELGVNALGLIRGRLLKEIGNRTSRALAFEESIECEISLDPHAALDWELVWTDVWHIGAMTGRLNGVPFDSEYRLLFTKEFQVRPAQ